MNDVSPRAAGWGCVAALATFVAPLALTWFVLPPAMSAYVRWRGDYGPNESPEALAYLFMIAASPFLLILCLTVGLVLAGLAFIVVSRRLDAASGDGKTRC